MFVELVCGSRRPKAFHTDETAVRAGPLFPAEANRGFNGDAHAVAIKIRNEIATRLAACPRSIIVLDEECL